MRLIPRIACWLATAAACCSGTAGGVDALELDALLQDIRWQGQWDPAGSQSRSLQVQELLDSPADAGWKFRLKLVQLQNQGSSAGFLGTLERMDNLLAELEAEGLADSALLAEWHITKAEFLTDHGNLLEAYAHLVAAAALLQLDSLPSLQLRVYQLGSCLNSVFELLELGRLVTDEFPVPDSIRTRWPLAFNKVRAYRALDRGDLVALDQALDLGGEQMDADSPDWELAEYWLLRCWEALYLGSEPKFNHFVDELRQLATDSRPPRFRAEVLLLEAVGRALIDRNPVTDTEFLMVADGLFREATIPAGLPVRLLRLWREFGTRLPLPNYISLMQGLSALQESNEFPVLRAAALKVLADVRHLQDDSPSAYEMLSNSLEQRQRLRLDLRPLHATWTVAVDAARQRQTSQREPFTWLYPLIFLLLLLSALLVVLILRRTRDEMESVRKLSRKEAEQTEKMQRLTEDLRRQFFANISHEIKTPLNGLLGMASLLDQFDLDPAQRKCVSTIHICAENLLVLINDLLDLSRLNSGDFPLDEAAFNFAEVRDYWVDLGRQITAGVGLELQIHVHGVLPAFLASDPVRISQIVLNLITHATRVTPVGAVILSISFRQDGMDSQTGNLEVAVEDCCGGLEPDHIASIFEPFSSELSQDIPARGNRLGLTISKQLAQRLGGSIHVENIPDKGCRFVLRTHTRIPAEEEVLRLNQRRDFDVLRRFGTVDHASVPAADS